MSDVIIIDGIPITVMEGQTVERVERIGTQRRAFLGNLLTSLRAEKRSWHVGSTALMRQAAGDALKAATALGAHVPCSGAYLPGVVTCSVLVGDGAYVTVEDGDGLGYMRTYSLTLIEV